MSGVWLSGGSQEVVQVGAAAALMGNNPAVTAGCCSCASASRCKVVRDYRVAEAVVALGVGAAKWQQATSNKRKLKHDVWTGVFTDVQWISMFGIEAGVVGRAQCWRHWHSRRRRVIVKARTAM